MRILFFSTAFPQPHDPSRCPYNLHRCRALAKAHAVRVISPRSWLDVRQQTQTHNEALASLTRGINVSYPTYYYPPRVGRAMHRWFLWHSVRATAMATIREFRPDVVLSYWTYPDGGVALDIARLARVPAVAIVGGSDVLLAAENGPAYRRRVSSVLASMDAVVAVSDHLRESIVRLGIHPEKLDVLPPAVDVGMFCPGDRDQARRAVGIEVDELALLWIGRMVPVKAVDTLLLAIRKIADSLPKLRLYLVGDGPSRAELERLARRLGIADRVTFVGRVGQPALPDWYRAANAVVLPSLSEGTPNVLLESRACGTPFVASAVGAVPTLAISGVDELVEPSQPEVLAAALQRSLNRTLILPGTAPVTGGWDKTESVLSAVLKSVAIPQRLLDAASDSVAVV